MYQAPAFTEPIAFLTHLARQRGQVRLGGVVDVTGAAQCLLQDWQRGKIPFYTRPPVRTKEHLSSSIVSQWTREFQLDKVEMVQVEGASEEKKWMELETSGCIEEMPMEDESEDESDESDDENDDNEMDFDQNDESEPIDESDNEMQSSQSDETNQEQNLVIAPQRQSHKSSSKQLPSSSPNDPRLNRQRQKEYLRQKKQQRALFKNCDDEYDFEMDASLPGL